jgi:hypothetical protein
LFVVISRREEEFPKIHNTNADKDADRPRSNIESRYADGVNADDEGRCRYREWSGSKSISAIGKPF